MAPERKLRAVFYESLKPHGRRNGVTEPEFEARRRSEVSNRAKRRAVAARAAAVQRCRGSAQTILVGELCLRRVVETDPGPQVEVFGRDQSPARSSTASPTSV